MKRSEVSKALRGMGKMTDRCSLKLSPFCYFTPGEWNERGHEYDEVRNNMLGWDITDFGMRGSDRVGFSLIILRNGNVSTDKYTRSYAEKLLYMKERQSAAMHFHWNKVEDIVNREGGDVLINIYNVGKEELADIDVRTHSDGREYTAPIGTQTRLCPRKSIAIQPYLYHNLHLEPGTGPVLSDEVSTCNGDNWDNRFYLSTGRLPVIEEDESPFRLLCNKYPPVDNCTKR